MDEYSMKCLKENYYALFLAIITERTANDALEDMGIRPYDIENRRSKWKRKQRKRM